MNGWLRERRFTLLVVGVAVPLIAAISFWSVIRPHWPFWLACYILGLPAGIVVTWGVNAYSRFGLVSRSVIAYSWAALPLPSFGLCLFFCLAIDPTDYSMQPQSQPPAYFS